MAAPLLHPPSSHIIPLELGRDYPTVVSGRGAWVEDAASKRYLDAMSGGSMAATLGHGRSDLLEVVRRSAQRVPFINNEWLTNPWQEELAARLTEVAPPGFTRVRFVTGGAEGNETAVRMARQYHVERGEPRRWQVISPAQSYHGPTMQTLALTGRPGLQGSFAPYLGEHLHIPPSTPRFGEDGWAALGELDRVLERAGPETVSLFFCEPVSAAALPAYSPPEAFWEGLAERRERHGFLIGFDEVVTGMGRTGDWFAAGRLPLVPDIIVSAKGLGAGYAALGAVLCRDDVYQAFAAGSGRFTLGHTWDGAPLSCAVGLAVVDVLRDEGWIEHVARRGPPLREQLESALSGIDMVGRVRGAGYLLGVEYADPRDGTSFLPRELKVAARVDRQCDDNGLLTLSTQPTGDGMAGDQSLFAPPFVTPESDLGEMVERFARSVREVAEQVGREGGL